MNRLGDCICAIPGKPPEEHNKGCPVYLRARWGTLDAFTEFVLASLGATISWIEAKAAECGPTPPAPAELVTLQGARLHAARSHLLDAQNLIAVAMGAGGDQPPGVRQQMETALRAVRAAPERWHPPATLPNQPSSVSYRFSADGSCLCVTLEVQPWAAHAVKAGRYAHPDCPASHDTRAVGVCTEHGPEVVDPRVMPDRPPFSVGAWAEGHGPRR
jgi:hypothetical protein